MTWRILEGDCLDTLRTLDAGSARCCVTSPPYWGLRDYGTGRWEGGDPACDHRRPVKESTEHVRRPGYADAFRNQASRSNHAEEPHFTTACGRCGARRVDGQIGLEETPADYVAKIVEVFAEVRRVLADDGTCWINLGDSYAQAGGTLRGESETQEAAIARQVKKGTSTGQHGGWESRASRAANTAAGGLKPKDLCGIPWRVAFALQADGWYLRSDIIWAKPNPMPESVGDRPTKSHEYVFLLSKREKYFYDADAVREPAAYGYSLGNGNRWRGVGDATKDPERGGFTVTPGEGGARNRRTVWTIPTAPYAEAHFATYPPALVEPCILAGSARGDTVLDPFAGSGTTGMVALRLGRNFVGCELSPKYAAMARSRILYDAPLLNRLGVVG